MTTVYLGVGSNIDPARYIPAAFDALANVGLAVAASSRFYRTAPIGRPEQAPYANGVWRLECDARPQTLRSSLKMIEERLGRIRGSDKFAPRSIDLDILLFGDSLIEDDGLLVPDPHILERPFLSLCLLEIDPTIVLPGTGAPLREIFEEPEQQLEEYPEITAIVRKKLEMTR